MSTVNGKLRTVLSVSWLSPVEQSTLESYVKNIRSMYGDSIQPVIMFGSRARGEGNEEFDIDVAVIITAEDPSPPIAEDVEQELAEVESFLQSIQSYDSDG